MEILAIIGSILLAACGAPLALDAIKHKRSDIPSLFLIMWGLGEVFTAIYVIYKGENALTLNYISNIIFIVPVAYYRYFPKR